MAALDKVIVAVSALVLLVVAGSLAYTALGGELVVQWLMALIYSPIDGGILSLLAGLVAVYLIVMAFKTEDQKAVVHATDLGAVRISLSSIKGLVERACRKVPGIKDVQVHLSEGEPLSVRLDLQLLPDFHIPQLTEEVQSSVQSYLRDTVGITVNEIQVFVKAIASEGKARVE